MARSLMTLARSKAKADRSPEEAESLRAYAREWRSRNQEKSRKYVRDYMRRLYASDSKFREQSVARSASYKRRRPADVKFGGYRTAAVRRGLEFSISFEVFLPIVNSDCFYCGAHPGPKLNGIDRIDSSVGYVVGNILPCCKPCNIAKSDMPQEDFLDLCRKIASRHK